MLCEKCKIREASIHYTEVAGGVKTEHNLCGRCAKEMDFGYYATIFDTDYPIGKLLSDLFGLDAGQGESEEPGMDRVVCPTCGTAYSDFVKDSRFGCPDCYQVFDLLMSETIKKIQGNDIHTGKHPRYSHTEAQRPEEQKAAEDSGTIEILQAKLKEAIREEEYELAAKYRDEIRELKERLDKNA